MSVSDVPAPTARLRFRRWEATDWPSAVALWGDARVTALVGGPFDEARVRARFDAERASADRHGVQYWMLFARSTDAHVGCAGLKERDVARGVWELGFQLRPEHWGTGLALEAARAVVAHAFDVLRARAVFAGHHPENEASRRIVTKLGMTYVLHEFYPPTGLQHPGYLVHFDAATRRTRAEISRARARRRFGRRGRRVARQSRATAK